VIVKIQKSSELTREQRRSLTFDLKSELGLGLGLGGGATAAVIPKMEFLSLENKEPVTVTAAATGEMTTPKSNNVDLAKLANKTPVCFYFYYFGDAMS